MNLLEHLQEQGIEYIPELYRQKLIELFNLDEEGCISSSADWPDVLKADVSEISEIIQYQYLLSLRLCYQEGLNVLSDLKYFLGLADSMGGN